MTTGMHLPGNLTGIGGTGGFLNWQRVHIGTQANHRAGRTPMYQSHQARLCNAAIDFSDAKVSQTLLHESRGFMAVKPELWILMQMAAPGFHILGKFGDTVDDWHGLAPYGLRKAEMMEQSNEE
jgi:hypothetical protein